MWKQQIVNLHIGYKNGNQLRWHIVKYGIDHLTFGGVFFFVAQNILGRRKFVERQLIVANKILWS